MLNSKNSKKSIIDRVLKLDKDTTSNTKPNLVMISLADNNKSWRIVEHYFKPNKQVYHKELIYDDYKKYLNTIHLNKNIPVIVNDIPR